MWRRSLLTSNKASASWASRVQNELSSAHGDVFFFSSAVLGGLLAATLRASAAAAAMGDGVQSAAEEGEFVGARLDAGIRAARFASPPSADDFAADVEPKNVPAVILRHPGVPLLCCFHQVSCSRVGESRLQVFRGVAKEWAASTRWDPLRGGLDYLLVSTNSLSFFFFLLSSVPNAHETWGRVIQLLGVFAATTCSSSNFSSGKSKKRYCCGSYDVEHWPCVLWGS